MQAPTSNRGRDAGAHQDSAVADGEPGDSVGGSSEVGEGTEDARGGGGGLAADSGSDASPSVGGRGVGGSKGTGGGPADAGVGGAVGKGGSVGPEAGLPEASKGGSPGTGGRAPLDSGTARGGSDADGSLSEDGPCTPTKDISLSTATPNATVQLGTTGAFCLRVTGTITGWNANSMAGRTISINGATPVSGDSGALQGASPGKWTDGKTYFDISAGQNSYAGVSLW